jgi:hypothetical protein
MWPTHAMSKALSRMGRHAVIGNDDMRRTTQNKADFYD